MRLDFHKFVENRVSAGIPPGVIFAKISRFETEYFAYGFLSLEDQSSPNLDTIFEIGSSTKVLVALLLARLEQLGKLSLEDSIRDFLPTSLSLPEREGRQITLKGPAYAHLIVTTNAF